MKKIQGKASELAELLLPHQSIELLQELHILTRDGKLNQDSRRKLKQVTHLCQFITPFLERLYQQNQNLCLVDHGAGKSYLGFILYDLYLKIKAPNARVIGIETRTDLVTKSVALAQRLKFENMFFHALTVEESITYPDFPETVEVVTALHACDTATDDAIRFGILKNAQVIVIVPCCQAEVAKLLRQNKGQSMKNSLSELWRHPLHTREYGSHLTNVLRCLQLQAHGYQVTVTELIGWEHSMKNELIIAQASPDVPKESAKQRLLEILEQMSLQSLSSRFLG